MIDNYKASELTDKLSAAFGNVKEEKVSIWSTRKTACKADKQGRYKDSGNKEDTG